MPDVSVRELTARLEQGVRDVFESDKYAAFLQTMSRFHNYSRRNIQLIHMQYPTATKVASYRSWKEDFNRQVKRYEHGIKILAPVPRGNETKEFEKLDPVTRQPVLDENGQPVMETLTSPGRIGFKTVSVFAYEQTDGEPLPELAETLTGDVERYELFMDALRAVSPLPIVFEDMPSDTDGLCVFGERIAIRNGMSEIQTVSAVVHEIAHAAIHDRSMTVDSEGPKNRRVLETEAESVSYVICCRFGLDTGANAFGYIAEYARSRELKELNASLDTIRKASAELITDIDKHYQALAKERGIDLSADTDELGAEQNLNMIDFINNEPPKAPEKLPGPSANSAEPDILAAYARNAEARAPRQEGLTILMPLLFEDGNLNRENKRSRVKAEPPIGKYKIFSKDVGTPQYELNYLFLMSASGYLVHIGNKEQQKDISEQKIDQYILDAITQFDGQLANPGGWADFTAAALLNRIGEAEAHNVPIRELREAERQAERELQKERDKRLAAEKQSILDARVDEIAKAVETGVRIQVEYDAGAYQGKNPVLELFKLYGVDIPLRTQGWVNNRLAAISGDGYSFYRRNGGKASSAFMDCLHMLIAEINRTPIEQKRGMPAAGHTADTEVKNTLEHELYNKFAAMFPDFAERKYSYMRLEADGFEPLSLEWLGTDTISMMHTYNMNGDLMYDPMITFSVDREARTMTAAEFEQSMPPLYRRVDENGDGASIDGNGNERNIRGLRKQIDDFASGWFRNLTEQGFMPVKAHLVIGESDEAEVTFDSNGNMIMPEATEQPAQPQSSEPNLLFPDPTVTHAERDAYGYTEPDMHPLNLDRALELFDAEQTVYLLYPDNTEAMALDRDEIITFMEDGGLCGISHSDWQFSGDFKTRALLSGFREDALESDLLFGGGSKFGIYQIPDYIDDYRDFRFASMRELEAHGLQPNRNNYKLVYTGNLDIHDRQSNLHKFFGMFQHDHPDCPRDFTARSVSVSDVIVLQWRGEVSAHYVDSLEFKELPSFTGNEREQSPEQTLLQTETRFEAQRRISEKSKNHEPQTLLGELAEAKDAIAKGSQPDAHKPNQREV